MLIRLPIGDDSQAFTTKINELFPQLKDETVVFLYNKYKTSNILQVVYELTNLYEVAFMTLDALGQQSWQFTTYFLSTIPNIAQMTKDDYDQYRSYALNQASGNDTIEEVRFNLTNIDNIFKKIAVDGYDSLNSDEKYLLKTIKKVL